jgi:hypothetical protein
MRIDPVAAPLRGLPPATFFCPCGTWRGHRRNTCNNFSANEKGASQKGSVMRNIRTLVGFIVVCVTLSASAAVVRFQHQMDDGTFITVDNASGWPQSTVVNLVYAADRSTRSGCPYDFGTKGLFKTGDRIFVNQNYLAWFDYTIGDGVVYPAGFDNGWSRSGELAGFWTIDSVTQFPKYFRQAPGGCWNWPANELISGSASGDGGGPYW